jgi:hypothetical protein
MGTDIGLAGSESESLSCAFGTSSVRPAALSQSPHEAANRVLASCGKDRSGRGSPCSDTRASSRGFFGPFRKFDVVSAARRDVRYRTALRRGSHYFPSVDQSLTSTRRSNPKSLGTQRQLSSGEGNMLTRIPAAFIATALLATAIASPALARSAPAGAQRAQQNSCASWHANAPRSDWECAHSSN